MISSGSLSVTNCSSGSGTDFPWHARGKAPQIMRRVIKLSPQAGQDLDQHLADVAGKKLENGMQLLDQFERDLLHLAAVHGTGRRLETKNTKLADVRSWAVTGFEPYILFYRPTGEGIEVIRVLHRDRDGEE